MLAYEYKYRFFCFGNVFVYIFFSLLSQRLSLVNKQGQTVHKGEQRRTVKQKSEKQ